MHPVFHSEFLGLDWSWIPLTDYAKLLGSKGYAYTALVSSLEKTFQNS